MTRKVLFMLGFAVLVFSQAKAQKMSVGDRLKMMTASEQIEKGNLDEAYRLYREVHRNVPDNGEVNYQCGKMAFELGRFTEAHIYFTKAVALKSKVGKDAQMWLGRAEHRLGMLEEATQSLEAFRKKIKGKAAAMHIVNEYIYQLDRAEKLLANPVKVTIQNMGDKINSEYVESNPSVTADGNTFIFTTARPENVGGAMDPVFKIYYQDIWMSIRDSVTGKWHEAERLVGELNTADHDANLSISSDGNIIFVYRSVRGGDIYYSKKKKNGEWRAPEPLNGKVNTTYFETGACMTSDKKQIFFISERPGKGKGNGDIWLAKKTGSFEYGEPVNINEVNTIDDESSVFLHPNGKTMYFSSNSKESMGGYDIFKSDLVDGKWSKPINLGYPINTLGDEKQFTISADGRTGYITTQREDSYGGFDIYEVDLSEYEIPNLEENQYAGSKSISIGDAVAIVKGRVLDKSDGEALEVMVRIENENGKVLEEIQTNENGEYFVTLPGGANYKIVIKAKDYKMVEELIHIPQLSSKSEVITRSFLLEDD